MENIQKKKIDRLTSTIILGIFLTIALIFSISTYFIDVSGMIEEMANDETNSLALALGAVFIVIAMILLLLIVSGVPLITSLICLPFAIKNRKSENKVTKIFSFVYDGIIGLNITLVVLKFILVSCGVS